jgi:hypothetical protein
LYVWWPFSSPLIFFNQCKRDNLWKINAKVQLLHFITIRTIPIVYNKKCPWVYLMLGFHEKKRTLGLL